MIGTAATRDRRRARRPTRPTPRRPTRRTSRRPSARWSTAGDRAAVVETTSHGLALERVGSIAYDVAILTNVTHEHLEFHGTWEAYRDGEAVAVRAARARAAAQRPSPSRRTALAEDRDRQRRRPVGRAVRRGDAGGRRPGPHLRDRSGAPTSAPRASRRTPTACAIAYVAPSGAASLAPAARRPVQRPQRPRRRRARRGRRPGPGCRARGARGRRGGPGTDGARGRRPAVRGHRRLRPQPGIAPDRARPPGARRRGPRRRAHRRVRVGRRARHGQAAARWVASRASVPGSSS